MRYFLSYIDLSNLFLLIFAHPFWNIRQGIDISAMASDDNEILEENGTQVLFLDNYLFFPDAIARFNCISPMEKVKRCWQEYRKFWTAERHGVFKSRNLFASNFTWYIQRAA